MKRSCNIVLFFLIVFLGGTISPSHTIETIYGSVEVTEPVILELLESWAFKRLESIQQYGVACKIHASKYPYSRYTHSLGVFYLLRAFGADLNEQIAGLLHDASHTVFSHVGDHVASRLRKEFFDQNNEAFQDCVHVAFLKKYGVADILARYTIPVESMDHKNGMYRMLERDLPDVCADRLEYILYGAYIEGWVSQDEIRTIIGSLVYQHGDWRFTNVHSAKQFALFSIRLCDEIFASMWNIGSYELAVDALLRAIELKLLTMEDIYSGRDDVVWKVMTSSNDQIIQNTISRLLQAKTLYEISDTLSYDIAYKAKFRGVDPLVCIDGVCSRLTEIDEDFARHFSSVRDRLSKTCYCREKQYK